jgi:hypothetical protein
MSISFNATRFSRGWPYCGAVLPLGLRTLAKKAALAGLGELGGHSFEGVLSLAVSFHFLILIDGFV